MRMRMFVDHQALHDKHLEPTQFQGKSHADVSAAFVGLMMVVFSGPWRGVLRESFYRIPEHPGSWEPMKKRARYLVNRVFGLMEPLLTTGTGSRNESQLPFNSCCRQIDNEMMNPNLTIKISDPKFRFYLTRSFDALVAGDFDPISDLTR